MNSLPATSGMDIFPSLVWSCIAGHCNTETLFNLGLALPKLTTEWPKAIRTNKYFAKVFPILFEQSYLTFEDAKQARLVSSEWNFVIMTYFRLTIVHETKPNAYKYVNRNPPVHLNIESAQRKDSSGICIWLPLRRSDCGRIQEMSNHPRCPSISQTLILMFPYMRRNTSLDFQAFVDFVLRFPQLWDSFSRIELVWNERYIIEITEAGAQMDENGIFNEQQFWNISEVPDLTPEWALQILFGMNNVKSFLATGSKMNGIMGRLHYIEHLSQLQFLTTGDWEEYDPSIQGTVVDAHELMELCCQNLKRLTALCWEYVRWSLRFYHYPNLEELHVTSYRVGTERLTLDLVNLLDWPFLMPNLEKLVLVSYDGVINTTAIRHSLMRRPNPIRLYTTRSSTDLTEIRIPL